jgi:hypothetical protein
LNKNITSLYFVHVAFLKIHPLKQPGVFLFCEATCPFSRSAAVWLNPAFARTTWSEARYVDAYVRGGRYCQARGGALLK